MVHIVLISHGPFCEGLLSTLQMISGDDCGAKTVALLEGETAEAYRERLRAVLSEVESADGTLVLSDIRGGTPYQSAAYLANDFRIGLVAGMNVPMVISLALERTDEMTLEEMIQKAVDPEILGVDGTLFRKGERKKRAKLSINKD